MGVKGRILLMIVQRCDTCKPHDFQDKTYGNKMRVFTVSGKSDSANKCWCTVCGKEGHC